MGKKREFTFDLQEVEERVSLHSPSGKMSIVNRISGVVIVKDDGEIEVFVDDDKQPYGMFETSDSFFKKVMKKIHNATKR